MKVTITGSTGFVGSNVAAIFQAYGHEVIGLVRREESLPWPSKVVDFSSEQSITDALVGADAVIHCAIANDFNRLVQDRDFAYDAFVGLTARVVKSANSVGAKPVFISTDWVMDGSSHLVLETDPGNAINFYGYLKALGEQVVKDLAPSNGAICRISGVMGLHQVRADTPRSQDVGFGYFVVSLVNALSKGETFTVWGGDRVNKITTPSLAAEIGAQLERVVTSGKSGTFHLVGDDAISRFDLATLTCEIFNLDTSLLREDDPPVSELFPAAVPVDSSLSNVETKKALGLGKTSLRDLLLALKSEIESGEPKAITQPRNSLDNLS
jgi:dTDP-4-dehydrorhamnose reductase